MKRAKLENSFNKKRNHLNCCNYKSQKKLTVSTSLRIQNQIYKKFERQQTIKVSGGL